MKPSIFPALQNIYVLLQIPPHIITVEKMPTDELTAPTPTPTTAVLLFVVTMVVICTVLVVVMSRNHMMSSPSEQQLEKFKNSVMFDHLSKNPKHFVTLPFLGTFMCGRVDNKMPMPYFFRPDDTDVIYFYGEKYPAATYNDIREFKHASLESLTQSRTSATMYIKGSGRYRLVRQEMMLQIIPEKRSQQNNMTVLPLVRNSENLRLVLSRPSVLVIANKLVLSPLYSKGIDAVKTRSNKFRFHCSILSSNSLVSPCPTVGKCSSYRNILFPSTSQTPENANVSNVISPTASIIKCEAYTIVPFEMNTHRMFSNIRSAISVRFVVPSKPAAATLLAPNATPSALNVTCVPAGNMMSIDIKNGNSILLPKISVMPESIMGIVWSNDLLTVATHHETRTWLQNFTVGLCRYTSTREFGSEYTPEGHPPNVIVYESIMNMTEALYPE